MAETVASESPQKIRSLFIILITSCNPSIPQNLWDTFKESMSEDILNRTREQNPDLQIDYNEDIFNEILIIIEDKVIDMVGKTLQELGFPHPARNNINRLQREILKETAYNAGDLEHYVTINEPLLVHDQKKVSI
uniref:Uncharacterized protein n=1 Tax=Arion vulgaris TaxID=1028688 RepID=A0A0B7BQJ0_9EUPU